jgi:double-stranded uracil-DNA glycosylase
VREEDGVPAKPLRDVVAPGLDVLFCGINPSLLSAARGHHFARPGNRFWPALHLAGLTPRLLTPDEDAELPGFGLGVTNLADRPTRTAAELTRSELQEGAAALAGLVARHRPRCSPSSGSPPTGSASTGRGPCWGGSPSPSAGRSPGWCRTPAA